MEKGVEIALLYDFYSGLLTDKQREYIQLRYWDDLSLAEIAETEGVTRQGARDALVRAEHILRDAEARTRLFERFGDISGRIDECIGLAEKSVNDSSSAPMLIERLKQLKGKVTDGI